MTISQGNNVLNVVNVNVASVRADAKNDKNGHNAKTEVTHEITEVGPEDRIRTTGSSSRVTTGAPATMMITTVVEMTITMIVIVGTTRRTVVVAVEVVAKEDEAGMGIKVVVDAAKGTSEISEVKTTKVRATSVSAGNVHLLSSSTEMKAGISRGTVTKGINQGANTVGRTIGKTIARTIDKIVVRKSLSPADSSSSSVRTVGITATTSTRMSTAVTRTSRTMGNKTVSKEDEDNVREDDQSGGNRGIRMRIVVVAAEVVVEEEGIRRENTDLIAENSMIDFRE